MKTEIRPPPEPEPEILVPERVSETAVITEDMLLATLEQVWAAVSGRYDVFTPMPEPAALFNDAPLNRPYEAAEMVLVNMLLEVIECVDRFSPWYTQPARAFGLATAAGQTPNCVRWRLTGKGTTRWWDHIDTLAAVIKKDSSLIEAMIYVDGLITAVINDDPRILAQCHCLPCRYIRLRKSILNKTEITCDLCHKPFFATGHYPGLDYES